MTTTNYDIQAGKITPLTADTDGGQLNLFPGFSTGLGRALVSVKKAGVSGSSGANLNSFVDGFIPGGFKILSDNVTTTLIHATVGAGIVAAFYIFYAVEVFNGTDLQIETGREDIAVYNKAGVYTSSIIEVKGINIHSAGSLAVVWTVTDGVDIQVNANSSLTPVAGYPRINFAILNLGNGIITIL